MPNRDDRLPTLARKPQCPSSAAGCKPDWRRWPVGLSLRLATTRSELSGLALGLLLTLTACGGDWPQWRGPNRDAVITDPARTLESLPKDPRVLWKIDASDGHASPVVAGGKLVYLDSQEGQETAHCVDASTGAKLWSVPVGPVVTFSNYGSGPRCTPMIAGDRVYVQSSGGEFKCLSLSDHRTLWQVSFDKDYGVTFLGNRASESYPKDTASRRHGHNGSAAIDGDRVFVPVGSTKGATLVAFDSRTGRELWRAGTDDTAYSSVVVGTLAGVRQAVHLTADALMGVDVSSGLILWREPVKTTSKRHACTPLIAGDTVTITSWTLGTARYRIVRKGAEFNVERLWVNTACKTIIGTPTRVGGHLYTIGPGQRTSLTCLDFETGREVWAQPGLADYASITAVNDTLLVHNSNGELILVKANPERYEELGRIQLCGKTWASPAYVDGRLYIKDATHVVAVEIAPGGAAAPAATAD